MLQCCVNGARPPSSHPELPVTPDEIVSAAVDAVAAGAQDLHVHPKGPDGQDTLDPTIAGSVARALRVHLPGVTFGFTTGAWTADRDERLSLVRAWEVVPDHASVNWHEDGAEELAATLIERGVGIEAGLWSGTAGIDRFLSSPIRNRVLRVLIEVRDTDAAAAITSADHLLGRVGHLAPGRILLHGEDGSAWVVLQEAAARELSTRVGLEDTLHLPDGSPAPDNAALVAAGLAAINRDRPIRPWSSDTPSASPWGSSSPS